MKKLSILIPTVVGREHKLLNLMDALGCKRVELVPSMPHAIWLNNDTEVIIFRDNKEISVGKKRQLLLEAATGEYVTFIDDDDMVPAYYVSEIMTAIENEPDTIGFFIDCDMQGEYKKAVASLRYKEWGENIDGYNYVRSPYQKTPIRREIALKIGYMDKRYAEDACYSERLMKSGLLKTEHFINLVMYYYQFNYENPETKYGITN